eukprot:2263932-Amphidinium_carterae.1
MSFKFDLGCILLPLYHQVHVECVEGLFPSGAPFYVALKIPAAKAHLAQYKKEVLTLTSSETIPSLVFREGLVLRHIVVFADCMTPYPPHSALARDRLRIQLVCLTTPHADPHQK